MYKFFFTTLFIIATFFVANTAYGGTLSCSMTTAALCTDTVIFRMSGSTNAHAELPNQSSVNYNNNVICCTGVSGLSNSCSGSFDTALKLSSATNAHVQQKQIGTYLNNACISVSSGTVSVGYQANNCTGYDTTLASMPSTTNSHIGGPNAYTQYKICATASATATPPVISSYSNTTETSLNYASSCTNCGARIGGGAGFRQSITITGTNFGADPGVSNRSTSVNNIKIGTHQIANANVTSWSNTSITFLTDSATAGDTDADWGANFGGASALTVTSNSQTSSGLNFYLFPQITSISGGVIADSAREYDAGDSDGIFTLNGTRFGTSIGSGGVSILGQTGTTTSWNNTAITVQVPTTISDTTNTGSLIITQGTGSNGKTNTYLNTIRILPRITSLSPNSGIVGTALTINGNHLCQSGTCPVSFSANNKVTFTSGIVATTFTSWSVTAIVTAVPTGATTGNVFVTSDTTYTSNNLLFTVAASTTTIATGSDPSTVTIAPGVSATDVNIFTLQTNSGTESISSVTVNLSTNNGIGLISITDNANTVLGSTSSPATGSNVISVSGMSATSSLSTFKVRITPLSHALMPAPVGATYSITAPVTSWAGGNTHAGSDTNTNALIIDNLSPGASTGATASPGDTQIQVSWANPGDGDFQKVIIYCKTSAITESPTEGTDPSVDGTACDSTARVKYSGSTSPQTFTGLTNGQIYYFRIYARDTNGNFTAYASTQQVSGTPTLTQVLTVGTVGTQATNLNSGTTTQHIGGGVTAAFTLQINTSTSNVTSVKISDTGTVAVANLTNPKLYYENATSAANCVYGGAESSINGAAPVGETITFTLPTVAIGVAANVTCLYFVSDINSSASGGQTIDLQITNPSTDVVVSSGVNTDTVAKAISGTTTIRPQITGYTNSTESSLNYSSSCTSCGARIGGGAGFRQSITIPGYGFGTVSSGNRSNATNNIKIGSKQIADANITAWTSTSITFLTDSATAGDTDADWGANFGGAAALTVTSGSQVVSVGLNFYIYPQITSITQPVGFSADSAREYDVGDSDGIVTVNGTRFGSSVGSGSVTVLGIVSTTNSWNNTSVVLQVPSSISDSVYTGNILVTQGTGANNKTHTYSTLRILPRILNLNPSSGSINEAITLSGNHLCQSGTCPGSFNATNKVTFTSNIVATLFTSWSHTSIVTAVPTGAVNGNVFATSDSYISNALNFNVQSVTPDDPTSLGQFEDVSFTQSIPTGDAILVPLYLKISMQVGPSGGTLYPQFEYKTIGTAFNCTTATSCADAVEGTGSAGPGPVNGSKSISPADGSYHWQARVKHTRNSVDYYSSWVSYGGNAENVADFIVDTTGPIISNISSGVPGTNGATITWDTTGEASSSQIQYNTTGIFVDNCTTNNDCTIIKDISPMVTSHSVTLSNLNSGTLYYYRVRSKDSSGNETISTNNTLTTQIVSNPLKTIKSFINGAEGSINSATTYYFTVNAPETGAQARNAYVEVSGIVSGGFSGTVAMNMNSSGAKNYQVNTASNNPTFYKFIYQIPSPNLEVNLNLNDGVPCTNGPGGGETCNKIIITPSTGSLNVLSAKIITTYSYTP